MKNLKQKIKDYIAERKLINKLWEEENRAHKMWHPRQKPGIFALLFKDLFDYLKQRLRR